MEPDSAYRVWWAAGAVFVTLAVVDFFVGLGWAAPSLETPAAWLLLAVVTLAFLGGTLILRPRRVKVR